eukprot:gene12678-3391_t
MDRRKRLETSRTLASCCDYEHYTDLATSSITQRQILHFRAPFNIVYYCLQTLAGKVEKLEIQGKQAFKVFDAITIYQEKGSVIIEWPSNPVNDMYADCVLTVILQVEGNPQFVQANRDRHFGSGNFHERLMSLLEEKYGKELVTESDDGVSITISVDGTIAVIDLETLSVECADESLNHLITTAVNNLNQAMTPITS